MTVTMGGRSVRTADGPAGLGFGPFPAFPFPPASDFGFSSGRRTNSTPKAPERTSRTFASAGAVAGTIKPAFIRAFTASALETPTFSARALIVDPSPISTVLLPSPPAPASSFAPPAGEARASSTS